MQAAAIVRCSLSVMNRPVFTESRLQEAFDRDGFAIVDCLAPDQIERLREAASRFESRASHEVSITYLTGQPELRAEVFEAISNVLAEPMAGLLAGYQPVCADFNIKDAGEPLVHPHRHWVVTDETRFVALTTWTPLDEVNETNGCVAIMPGSHADRRLTGFRDYELNFESGFLSLPMHPGQVLLMDNRMIHGSLPNQTGRPRRAVTFWQAPMARPLWCGFEDTGLVEIYEVDAAFYRQRHHPYLRPQEGRLVARLPGGHFNPRGS